MRSPGRANGRERTLHALFAALVFAAVWIAFAPALDAGFLNWDDDRNITSNSSFRGLSRAHLAWMFSTVEMGPYQPLAWITLALDHAMHGLDARAFHRTNVALHGATAVAFYFLAAELFASAATAWRETRAKSAVVPLRENDAARGPWHLACAALAALLFAIHPLRVESVAWVTERRDVLSGLFFVLALDAYVRWARERKAAIPPLRRSLAIAASCAVLVLFFGSVGLADGNHLALRGLDKPGIVLAWSALLVGAAAVNGPRGGGWFAILLLCFLASLASKGLSIVLPVFALVLDVWPLRRNRGARFVDLVIEKLPLLALAVVFGIIASWGQSAQIASVASWHEHTFVERLAQVAYGVAFYVRKTIAPVGLLPIYELPEVLSFSEPRYWMAVVSVVIVTVLTVKYARRAPAIACAGIAYVVAIAPVAGMFQTGPQIAADRYSYLACMPFALLLGGGAWWIGERRRALRTALAIASGVVVLLLARATWTQTQHWRDSESLWSYTLAANPESPLAHLNLGDVRLKAAQSERDAARKRELLDEAEVLFRAGLAFDRHARFLTNLAIVEGERAALEPSEKQRHFEAALATMRAAMAVAEEDGAVVPEMRQTLGLFLFEVGHTDEALGELAAYVRARPQDVTGLYNYGLALSRAGRHRDAAVAFERALTIAPQNAALWRELGNARFASGERDGGVQAVERALAIDPGDAAASQLLQQARRR